MYSLENKTNYRADFRFAPSQWETTLQSTAVSLQYQQCWLDIHYNEIMSCRNITYIVNNIKKIRVYFEINDPLT